MVVSTPQMNLMSFVKLMESRGNFSAAKSQQNGVVERKNMIVQEVTRTMLNEAKLPNGYWREEIYTNIYVQNLGKLRVKT